MSLLSPSIFFPSPLGWLFGFLIFLSFFFFFFFFFFCFHVSIAPFQEKLSRDVYIYICVGKLGRCKRNMELSFFFVLSAGIRLTKRSSLG